ncbi:hypothetical protein ACWASX_004092 [Klebsiella variicola]
MTSKFTREELLNIIDTDHVQCGEASALARMVLAAMDSEPVIADCDPEVYEKGVSACFVVIPKETAEVICKGISAATGCKVDWHYIGGRVHIKALQAAPQPAPVVDSEPVAEVCEDYALRYISHGPVPKEGLQPGDKFYRHAQQPVVIKGHQVRELVDSIHDIAVEHHDSQQLRRYIHNAVWSFIPHVLPGEKEVIPASSGECNDPHVWALNQMESILYIDNETPPEMRKGLVLATYLCRTLKSLIKNGAFEGKEISEQQLIKSIRDRK